MINRMFCHGKVVVICHDDNPHKTVMWPLDLLPLINTIY